jgi:tRNA-Thr(GGU) m(6)t(6)A37 methyltransferase TsaA
VKQPPSSFHYQPIGVIHTPYRTLESIPKAFGQPPLGEGTVVIHPGFEEGLLDIERFSHLILIFAFHLSRDKPLRVVPPGQERERGVFGTRSPQRPNSIGLLTVELLARRGNILSVRGLDVLDGTPVLDIKPYLLHFDCRPKALKGD